MAKVYETRAVYKNAEECLKQSMKMNLGVFGSEDNVEYSKCMSLMGQVLDSQGKYKEALERYEKALNVDRGFCFLWMEEARGLPSDFKTLFGDSLYIIGSGMS
jgi:tetratricopeptide (TPR) repeat protein